MVAAGSGTKVVKSSGETEVFDPNIITSDCVEAGVEFWIAAEVALEVSQDVFDGINSDEIQRKILSALYNRNPEVAERYKRFHSMYVRTSSNTIERFDRKRIVNSLVKETLLPKEVAEIIARETESELRRMNLDFTSGPLIREIVNVKLLEHGYEGARSDYTRLGMPVYDAAQFIEAAPGAQAYPSYPEAIHKEMANSIFKEYSLLKVLPLHLADAHMKGDLHVHDLEYFVTRPCTALHDARYFLKNGLRFDVASRGGTVSGPAKNAFTAVLHSIKALMALRSNFSSTQGFHSFNVWIAPYLEGLTDGEIKQLAQTCLFEISQSFLFSGQDSSPVDLEIEYGIPEAIAKIPATLPGGRVKKGIYYSDFEDEARKFALALTEGYSKGDYNGERFKSPRLICKLRIEDESKEGYEDFKFLIHEAAAKKRPINLLNLSTSNLGSVTSAHSSGILFQAKEKELKDLKGGVMRPSSLQFITLNLPRIAYKAGGKEERFFETLNDTIGLAREITMVKQDVISKRMKRGSLSLLSQSTDHGSYFDLKSALSLVGYVGLNEAVKAHLGEELHESSSALEFGVSVIKHVSELLGDWSKDTGMGLSLASVDTPFVAQRFAMLDSGQFSEVALVKGDLNSMNIHYSSSCRVANEAKLPITERLKTEAPFQGLNTGGMMETIKVKKAGPEELLSLSKEMVKARVGYWSFVP
jgi:ribonucleoside-triphosphate reductase